MSPHKLHVILSEGAKTDIVDILQYTYDTWGDAQMYAYGSLTVAHTDTLFINSE